MMCIFTSLFTAQAEKIDDDYAVFASAGGVRSFFRGEEAYQRIQSVSP